MYRIGFLLFLAGSVLLLSNLASGAPLLEEVELAYDDGVPDGSVTWQPGVVAAVRMSLPQGTWKLKTARYYLFGGEGTVRIFDDHIGQPGSDLIQGFPISYYEEPGWFDVDLADSNITVTGEFYLGIECGDYPDRIMIGHDFLEGGNGRSWDFLPSEGWSENPANTYFIRAVISDEPGIDEERHPESTISLDCRPNPFYQSTSIRYTLPLAGWVTVSIWDANGRCVRVLTDAFETEDNHSIEWDNSDNLNNLMPAGVYYTRIKFSGTSTARKMVLVR